MARLARLSIAQQPHHAVQRGNNRQPIFVDAADRERFLALVGEGAARFGIALHAYVHHGFAQQPDGSVTLKCRPEVEARVYEMGSRHHAWDALPAVGCPVTVVRGTLDAPGPAAFAAAVAERLPAGRLEVHDDLDHFGPLCAPDAMAASVLASSPG